MNKSTARTLRAALPEDISKNQWRKLKRKYNALDWQIKTMMLGLAHLIRRQED